MNALHTHIHKANAFASGALNHQGVRIIAILICLILLTTPFIAMLYTAPTLAGSDDSGLPPLPPIKNAYINGSQIAQNGEASSPVPVSVGDEIKYTIDTTNTIEVGLNPAKYDVLFVLDWSDSMSSTMSGGVIARDYQRMVMLDMADYVLNNYPESRVALLGMNTSGYSTSPPFPTTWAWNCSNNPGHTYLQLQTDFLNSAQFTSQRPSIVTAFNSAIAFTADDNSTFLRAGVDKMMGLSNSYGYAIPFSGYSRNIVPRTGPDLAERIPVIMHLADFMMYEPTNQYWNNSGTNYWSVAMKTQADRFAAAYPNGVLQTVRIDHAFNTNGSLNPGDPFWPGFPIYPFNTSAYTNLMTTYVSPAGRDHWGFTIVTHNTSYQNALSDIKADFTDLVPYEKEIGSIVTDEVPEDLDVDISSINHGGVFDSEKRTITWDLSNYKSGEGITLEFKTTVKVDADFENTAEVAHANGITYLSNTTYHTSVKQTVTEYFREFGNETHVLDSSRDGNEIKVSSGHPYQPAEGTPPATITKGGVTYYYFGYRVGSGRIIYQPHELLPSTLIASVTSPLTVTYLYMPAPAKNAYINSSVVAENGTETNPVVVKKNDEITYAIDVVNAKDESLTYDVLFLVDWSNSMGGGPNSFMTSNGSSGQALRYQQDIVLDMSAYIFENYPGSRIGVLGMNAHGGNTNLPGHTNIQFETDFVGVDGYVDIIQQTFVVNPTFDYNNDDLAMFLRAGTEKMNNGTLTAYGGLGHSGVTVPANQQVGPRSDTSRIPIIVLISDFQLSALSKVDNPGDNIYNNTNENYWTGSMAPQVEEFEAAFPDGILFAVRLDTWGNVNGVSNGAGGQHIFSSQDYTDLMTKHVAPHRDDQGMVQGSADRYLKGWRSVIVPFGNTYESALDKVMNSFVASAPAPNTMVFDTIAPGLELVGGTITHGGVYDSQTRTITWDLSDYQNGEPLTLQFKTRVTGKDEAGDDIHIIENTATVDWFGTLKKETNTTYHKLVQFILHLRQVVVYPFNGTITVPYSGYFNLRNGSDLFGVTTLSNKEGVAVPYRTFTLPVGPNLLYEIIGVVPQYYRYLGFVRTTADTPHSSTALTGGIDTTPTVDFNAVREYWVTVYITPSHTDPGLFDWDFKTNDFGILLPLNPPIPP